MCGVFGSIRSGHDAPNLDVELSRLSHRGPDDLGQWRSPDGKVSLGHVRLSIQDLSSLGSQPMVSRDERYVIVFNGEIYNFRKIRERLISCGHQFHSTGDTEVVLAAYQEWGTACVEHFNGMFALAVLDQGTSGVEATLFLARDRVGEKPLYYTHEDKGFNFSSELKALSHSSDLNLISLNYYLALGYVPANQCLFEGVQKLSPAHCALYRIATGDLEIWRYWSLPPNRSNEFEDGQELAHKAGRLIEESVRLRLAADVPVGVLLSGGLDSSLVAAAAARVSSRTVQTFTIAMPGSPLDEAHHAQKVASFLGTDHHILELAKPSLSLIDEIAPFVDEPIADSSVLPAWSVFRLARQRVKVALGGDGGDELFGGYTDYTVSLMDQQKWGKIPSRGFWAIASLASKLPAGIKGRNRLASLRGGPLQQMIWGRPYFDWVLRQRILIKEARHFLGVENIQPEEFLLTLFESGISDVDRMSRTHFGSILPDDFLVKVDRMSMAHSLEIRAPLLDQHLVEFCFSQVPDQWKVYGGEARRLQRILAQSWLPSDLDTRRKQGFSIPVNEWLRSESEANLMSRMEALPEVINMDEVQRLVRGHLSGRANGGRLFALIMLATAMRNRCL